MRPFLLLLAVACILVGCAEAPSRAAVTRLPEGEAASDLYRLRIDGAEVPVQVCRVSRWPFNQRWPGHQRPLDQTELAAFAGWDMAAPVQVEVEAARDIGSAVVRPLALGITPVVEGRRIRFTVREPRPLVLEVDGRHQALHLFPDPPEADAPASQDPGVRWYGPGVHEAGIIRLRSGERLHIARGAVVHGAIEAEDAHGIRISGRGVLDNARQERAGYGKGTCLRLARCTDVRVEGLTLRDPSEWSVMLMACADVRLDRLKLIGHWRYNTDGIDVCNSSRVTVADTFVRSFDDSLVVKGHRWTDTARPVEDVVFERCVLWCDWGRALEIGAQTQAPAIRRVVFRDIDVIRSTRFVMSVNPADNALVEDIRFEGVRVELDGGPVPRVQQKPDEVFPGHDGESHVPRLIEVDVGHSFYAKDARRGQVRGLHFRGIHVTGGRPLSRLLGFDAEHAVDGVVVEDLRFDGVPATTPAEAGIEIQEHVRGVVVR